MNWRRHPGVRTGSELSLGERSADKVRNGMGSWTFIGLQTLFILAWVAGNLYLLSRPFDPFPFILLNLAFSVQAAYASPIILLSQKRADQRGAEVALGDYETDQATLAELRELRREHAELHREHGELRQDITALRAELKSARVATSVDGVVVTQTPIEIPGR